MTTQPTFELRKEELRRRVEALPKEVAQWKKRTTDELDKNVHFSQLNAIGVLTDAFTQKQNNLLNQMDPGGDKLAFESTMLNLIKSIIQSQRMWDFFRDKLDLRFSPTFKEVLWVADTIAWDCYRPVLEDAAYAGILKHTNLREPPLTYLTAEFSPATWVRGSRPNDGREYHLGTSNLPIPVIELPWDHMENSWEFISLHHEVGHDLEVDLKLRNVLLGNLHTELLNAGVPDNRIQQWLNWQGEIFADLVGLQLGGPAFAEGLAHLLLLPQDMVTAYDPDDPHPTHYPRVLMNTAYIPTMIPGNAALTNHSQQISSRWTSVYGVQPQFDPLMDDFPVVYKALMDTPFPTLKGKTVRQLMPYTAADDQLIRSAVNYMRTGMNKPETLRPRYCISAARLAVTQAALEGALTDDVLSQINQRAMQLVRSNAPGGLRAGDTSTPHQEFIASYVDKW